MCCSLRLVWEEVKTVTVQSQVFWHLQVVDVLSAIVEITHHLNQVIFAEVNADSFTRLFKYLLRDYSWIGCVSPCQLLVDVSPFVPELRPEVLLAELIEIVFPWSAWALTHIGHRGCNILSFLGCIFWILILVYVESIEFQSLQCGCLQIFPVLLRRITTCEHREIVFWLLAS